MSGYSRRQGLLPSTLIAMLIFFLTKRTLVLPGWLCTPLRYSPPPRWLAASQGQVPASGQDVTGTVQQGVSGKAGVFIMRRTDSVFTCLLPFALALGTDRNMGTMPEQWSFSHKEESPIVWMVEERENSLSSCISLGTSRLPAK